MGFAQLSVAESKALIQRVVPKSAGQFTIEPLKDSGKDEFEIESVNNKVVLRGNNGVAIVRLYIIKYELGSWVY